MQNIFSLCGKCRFYVKLCCYCYPPVIISKSFEEQKTVRPHINFIDLGCSKWNCKYFGWLYCTKDCEFFIGDLRVGLAEQNRCSIKDE